MTASRRPRHDSDPPRDPRLAAADAAEVARQRALSPAERLAEAVELSRRATELAGRAATRRR